MRQVRSPRGYTIRPFEPLVPVGQQPMSEHGALPMEMLEHGAYYAGKLGVTLMVARWHAKKRRFVFGEFSLGRQTVKSAAHIAERGAGERFIPLSKTTPKDNCRVSDYAFETTT